MGSSPGLRCSSRLRAVPKPWGEPTPPGPPRGVSLSSVRSFLPRILTVGLVCASLYAAFLGAGAVAQDERPRPSHGGGRDRDAGRDGGDLHADAVPLAGRDRRRRDARAHADRHAARRGPHGRADRGARARPRADATPGRRPPRRPPSRRRRSRRQAATGRRQDQARPQAREPEPQAGVGRQLPDRRQAASARSSTPQPQALVETASRSRRRRRRRRRRAGPLGDDTPAPTVQSERHPDAGQPGLLARDPRAGRDRRPELLHREVPHPAVPAPDLPGRRHPVRHPLGGPGGDQRDRDRLRPQPQHLLRRRARAGCSSCPPPGTCTASTPTATARRTRSTRWTRSSPPRATCAPRAPTRTSTARSSPTTTPTGTSSPCSCGRE